MGILSKLKPKGPKLPGTKKVDKAVGLSKGPAKVAAPLVKGPSPVESTTPASRSGMKPGMVARKPMQVGGAASASRAMSTSPGLVDDAKGARRRVMK